MNALLVHNHYHYPGGEDRVFADESMMLEAHRHEVAHYTLHNDAVQLRRASDAARLAAWNPAAYRAVRALLREKRSAVMHCHNTFPLVSPAVYWAARAERVPIVQTLHNYRLLCPGVHLYRDRRPCESCLGHALAWRGVVHGCYRESVGASAVAATVVAGHRGLGTWRLVSVYIAPSRFTRRKYLEGGWPADAVVVKPHFVHPDPGAGAGDGGYALYVGRLSPEKGVTTLLAAWRLLGARLPLRIVGDGPLADDVKRAVQDGSSIEWLGQRDPADVARLVAGARVVIVPSECYETFGRAVIESFAGGTPVIAANIGALAELVEPGRTGLLFSPAEPASLAEQVLVLLGDDRAASAMRREARDEFEAKYTMARNYAMLHEIYETARERAA